MQKRKRNILVVVLIIIVSPFAMLLTAKIILDQPFILPPPSPPSFFRKVVLKPIPESVKNIKFDRYRRFSEHRWILRFDLSKSDLPLIIDSGPFMEVPFFEYNEKYGVITFGESRHKRDTVPLYSPVDKWSPPDWFQLGQWENPKVYMMEQKSFEGVRMLVYNEELSEAYFVDWQWRN
ncbi:MAG: hypothetical protein HQ580_01830 [Planctomycetes bacterium]|nr:hypothetical protein [Planctomycetota bacterium]